MKQIAILSDTHGILRPQVLRALKKADFVLHAGDLDTRSVADVILQRPGHYLVRGNNDWGSWASVLPPSQTFVLEGLRFFMVHNRRDVPQNLTDIDVVVYGHSHRYEQTIRGGVLWLNPGSCGEARFGGDVSFCWMKLEGRDYRIERVML